ncbi:major histocompatibility complex class I-related gene protein-like isoform X2 [Dendropsophus ebraccatus]|uniref:major histocompatibility complex class I-related gene protein-like isoform X2 n=1 Tax=Dendropsophus ebraccatus TaxID=150705 RepID=UPI003831422C
MEMCVLTLMFLSVSGVCSDSHSLRYYSIGVSAPGSSVLDFSIVAYVDDRKTELYTSDTGRRIPVAQWMKEKESPGYWERRTRSSKLYEALFKHEMTQWRMRFNHTEGFHFLQIITGCELGHDGSITSYRQIRYDGEEYMYYDLPTGAFIPSMDEAQLTAQRWNTKDAGIGKSTKRCLKNECIERLKRFIEYGREDLERRVRPGVKVTGRESGEVTKLHCLVYGFHPRAVDVKWMKNGIDDVPTDESTRTLPNPDGTYQIRVTAEVIPKEDDSYFCYVDHSSLEEPLLVRWVKSDSPLAVIVGVLVSILLILLSVIVGIIIYRDKD